MANPITCVLQMAQTTSVCGMWHWAWQIGQEVESSAADWARKVDWSSTQGRYTA